MAVCSCLRRQKCDSLIPRLVDYDVESVLGRYNEFKLKMNKVRSTALFPETVPVNEYIERGRI